MKDVVTIRLLDREFLQPTRQNSAHLYLAQYLYPRPTPALPAGELRKSLFSNLKSQFSTLLFRGQQECR